MSEDAKELTRGGPGSPCVEPVLEFKLECVATAEALGTPNWVALYSKSQLLEAKQKILDRYPNRPGLFSAKNMIARELYINRYPEQKKKAERRQQIAEQKFILFKSLREFDKAISELDFELANRNVLALEPKRARSQSPSPPRRSRRKSTQLELPEPPQQTPTHSSRRAVSPAAEDLSSPPPRRAPPPPPVGASSMPPPPSPSRVETPRKAPPASAPRASEFTWAPQKTKPKPPLRAPSPERVGLIDKEIGEASDSEDMGLGEKESDGGDLFSTPDSSVPQ